MKFYKIEYDTVKVMAYNQNMRQVEARIKHTGRVMITLCGWIGELEHLDHIDANTELSIVIKTSQPSQASAATKD